MDKSNIKDSYGIPRDTLNRLENGNPAGVTCTRAGSRPDVLLRDDALGRKLQDLELEPAARASGGEG